ncbi:hypothetical protein F6X53_22555 [Methylobacterium soli]|uniref:Uncharacterized protein n=1 Tax=Methylobacterium soli TaxID=553447 RepID=A0A6L3SSZ7_9HYPH|nr:hypothetical protein F6X53_22555 [Methylobacterium soli]
MRTATGLSGTPALALSAWRGVSGKRYVVGVHQLTTTNVVDAGPGVMIAVRRDEAGIAEPISIIADGIVGRIAAWTGEALRIGATELHVHRLGKHANERAAIVDDLTVTAPAADLEVA